MTQLYIPHMHLLYLCNVLQLYEYSFSWSHEHNSVKTERDFEKLMCLKLLIPHAGCCEDAKRLMIEFVIVTEMKCFKCTDNYVYISLCFHDAMERVPGGTSRRQFKGDVLHLDSVRIEQNTRAAARVFVRCDFLHESSMLRKHNIN
jgi:hypothetical protein